MTFTFYAWSSQILSARPVCDAFSIAVLGTLIAMNAVFVVPLEDSLLQWNVQDCVPLDKNICHKEGPKVVVQANLLVLVMDKCAEKYPG